MHPGRNGHGRRRGRGAAADAAGFIVTGFAAVFTAVSFLLTVIVGAGDRVTGGGSDHGGTPVGSGTAWQVILAFGLMSTGLLMVMYGMRAPRGARPPPLVRRVADAAGAALLHAGGPERLLVPVMILLVLPFLEAWFDFF
ncbi:hypothetical protein HU200_063438 [Digitaria exilis]|uniref:Uncharacterized protein n=1 Tax=Digitaria exilis TaxID=1010633 RepID=A0A835A365_9POAL|nr:hypothetical protein HU200_063438 [Digitaria exilis]